MFGIWAPTLNWTRLRVGNIIPLLRLVELLRFCGLLYTFKNQLIGKDVYYE